MTGTFRIIHPNLENHQIFKVQVDSKKISKLFDLEIKKVNPINEGNGDGIYSIHFKEKLIYIGRHNTENNVVERWEKHLKTLTGRFMPINFLGADKEKGSNKVKRFYKHNGKELSFNELLNYFDNHFIKNKVNINTETDMFEKIKTIIEEHIEKKRDDLRARYQNLIKGEFEDFFKKIDAFSNKKIIQTLTGEGSVTSPNRFNFAINHRSDFLNQNENNIFEDFSFVFYKHLGKKFKSGKLFENKFEKPLIKHFSPEANNDSDKGLKFINASYEEILNYLNKLIFN